MQEKLKDLIVKILLETAEKIKSGTCELSEEEASDIMSIVAHTAMSKMQACEYVHLHRSRFDDLVAAGRLPKGRARKGFHDLVWYKDELDYYLLTKKL